MGKIKTEKFYMGGSEPMDQRINFKMDINVNQEGLFTCTLPEDVATKLMDAGIELSINRRGDRPGYIETKSMEELKERVQDLFNEYYSKELISETIVIKYQLETCGGYQINKAGEFCPNGQYQWTNGEECGWEEGTIKTHGSNHSPFGFTVYTRPMIKRVYRYKSGMEKEFNENLYHIDDTKKNIEKGYGKNLRWLSCIVGNEENRDGTMQEIEYTEEIAGVFVGFYITIFKINEKIREWTTPDKIQELAKSGIKILDQ